MREIGPLRYSALASEHQAEAEHFLILAQVAVTEKYRQSEELARKNGGQIHFDAPYIPPFNP